MALGRRGQFRKYVFTFGRGLVQCGHCGSAITGETHKGHVYYLCTNSTKNCPHRKFIREEVLEYQIIEMFDSLRIPEAVKAYAAARVPPTTEDTSHVASLMRSRFQAQLLEHQGSLDRLLDLKNSPGNAAGLLLSEAEYEKHRHRLSEEMESCKSQLASLSQVAGKRDASPLDDLRSLIEKFNDATSEEKRALLHQVGKNWKITNRRITGEFREPFATLVSLVTEPLAVA
jgi:site-specific DNA recombinase